MENGKGIKRVVVTGVLVRKNDTYLLVKKQGVVGPYPGTYLTPGGHVEEGEWMDEAALRELFEETGVRVTNLKRVWLDDDITENRKGTTVHMVMLLYAADYSSGELASQAGNDDAISDLRWFTVDEIKRLPLSAP